MNDITDFDREHYLRRATLQIAMGREDEKWFADQSLHLMRRVWWRQCGNTPEDFAAYWKEKAKTHPDRQDLCLKLHDMWWNYGIWSGDTQLAEDTEYF